MNAKSSSRRAWLRIAVMTTPRANTSATSYPPVTFSTWPGERRAAGDGPGLRLAIQVALMPDAGIKRPGLGAG
jgi:hypothetical protein